MKLKIELGDNTLKVLTALATSISALAGSQVVLSSEILTVEGTSSGSGSTKTGGLSDHGDGFSGTVKKKTQAKEPHVKKSVSKVENKKPKKTEIKKETKTERVKFETLRDCVVGAVGSKGENRDEVFAIIQTFNKADGTPVDMLPDVLEDDWAALIKKLAKVGG